MKKLPHEIEIKAYITPGAKEYAWRRIDLDHALNAIAKSGQAIQDAEDIVYYIQGEHVAPYLYNALPMRFMVKKDQARKAREPLKNVELSYSYGGRKSPEDVNDNGKT